MKSSEIRRSFLDYFAQRGHRVVKSSGLVPMGDPTLLFTNAGMVQFKGVFLGEETREYSRAVSSQKCMRAGGKHNDLENVGHTERHHTFFEMLGNFSFGDYFKEGAIEYGWQFLTEVMGLPAERLWATVYEDDDEAARLWVEKTPLPPERVVRLGEKDNFWSMGETGPCGPCSEIIIDQGEDVGCGRPGCAVGCDCDRYLELWNLVFMQYNRDASGRLTPLAKPSIDTGMGLERLTAVLQGKHSNYDTDLFIPIISRIEELSGVRYGDSPSSDVSIKAVADHARAVTFLITDGILPSNEGRGYVLRRILRRAVRHGRFLGLSGPFLHKVAETVIEIMGEAYPEVVQAARTVEKATRSEEERFFETLERGLAMLDAEVAALEASGGRVLSGETTFRLYDTYGFPVDLTADIVRERGIDIDEAGFNECMEEQRRKARSNWKGASAGEAGELYARLAEAGLRSEFVGYGLDAATSRVLCIISGSGTVEEAAAGGRVGIVTEETPFYGESGGQVGDRGVISGRSFRAEVLDTKRPLPSLIVHSVEVVEGCVRVGDSVELAVDAERREALRRNHTATHLLHAALRELLGEHVRQSGSLVTEGHLRFDFSHFQGLGRAEIDAVEERVNRAVMANREVLTETLPYDEALRRGALAFFGDKYGERVRVVEVPGVSVELCGGTHAARTGDIGLVRITSESSVAAGVRRIEAVTGIEALRWSRKAESMLRQSAALLRSSPAEVPDKIRKLMERAKELEKRLHEAKSTGTATEIDSLAASARTVAGVKVLAAVVDGDPRALRSMADVLRGKLGSAVVVLGSAAGGKASLLAAVTRDLTGRISAGEVVKRLAPVVGGRGGGRAELAQAGGKDTARLAEAVESAFDTVAALLK
ncbi:MAG TPA: alanine--tRNA ligase [Deltaproteobacteria bacterium]|nr:alanine--tRNA ligase [Deltaproteobacteria bacterium]